LPCNLTVKRRIEVNGRFNREFTRHGDDGGYLFGGRTNGFNPYWNCGLVDTTSSSGSLWIGGFGSGAIRFTARYR
jgi:hypothetical protein